MHNLKKLKTWKSCEISISFQRYIICIIPFSRLQIMSKIRSARFFGRFPIFSIFQILQKLYIIWKNSKHKKVAEFQYLSNGISFASFHSAVCKIDKKYVPLGFLADFRFSLFYKLFKFCSDSKKTQNIKKLRNFNIFPTVYHLHHSVQ